MNTPTGVTAGGAIVGASDTAGGDCVAASATVAASVLPHAPVVAAATDSKAEARATAGPTNSKSVRSTCASVAATPRRAWRRRTPPVAMHRSATHSDEEAALAVSLSLEDDAARGIVLVPPDAPRACPREERVSADTSAAMRRAARAAASAAGAAAAATAPAGAPVAKAGSAIGHIATMQPLWLTSWTNPPLRFTSATTRDKAVSSAARSFALYRCARAAAARWEGTALDDCGGGVTAATATVAGRPTGETPRRLGAAEHFAGNGGGGCRRGTLLLPD
jgi:hypothetical protein